MSTQINVTVGGGGLLDQSRRNQEEARWRMTEGERKRWELQQREQQEQQGEQRGPVLDWGRLLQSMRRGEEPAAWRRLGGPAIGYSQLLSISKTEGNWATGFTFTWTCRVYSGDGTASVEVEHSSTTPGYSWAGGVGAPSYTPLLSNYDEGAPISYIGDAQTGYMSRSQVGEQYDGDLGITFPPTDPAVFVPNVAPDGRPYVLVNLLRIGKREGITDGAYNTYVFPVGKGTNLVVTHYSRAWSIIETRSTSETYYDYTGLPSPFIQFATRGNYVLEGVSNSAGLSSSVRCVLTTASSAREVSVPAAFKERLDEVAGTTYDTSTKGGVRYTAWGTYTNPETGQTQNTPDGTYDANYPIHSYPTPKVLTGFQGEVQRSHGITQIVDGVMNWGVISGSPSAFFYLGVTDPDNSYAESYEVGPAAWDQTLRTATGKVPTIGAPTTEEAPYEVRLYRGPLPEGRYDTIAADAQGMGRVVSSFTPTVTVTEPPFVEGEFSTVNLLRTTDWGQAAYCREQLLALGFSAADLTP